jgi:hypothetical protein
VYLLSTHTSLDTLANNLKEINSEYEWSNWIDLVVVLDQGFIGYVVQLPFGSDFPAWLGGACADNFPIPPYYMHLAMCRAGESTLNHFFVKLMAQLTFFRKRSTVDFREILGPNPHETMTIQGYQYNLKRQLVPAEDNHHQGTFRNPRIRYNLYGKTVACSRAKCAFFPGKTEP